ncbi:hypothetical protein DFR49_0221 [Hephaestia caeni]|uniref:Uncharacterized protein n=1 Tax=Hephaestia caeni TaxID=645617 RepID=A0A397P812_9SPHN|nr:hypothetical protein [Hephaestia caeni]RIA45696.1 hypothetical protein DFR49_0221 [Hephaestia caeni]
MLIFAIMAAMAGAQDVPRPEPAATPVMGPVLAPAPLPSEPVLLNVAERALECRAAPDSDIVVCADRDDERFRLRPLPVKEAATPLRAEATLFGTATASADVESEALQQGLISKRLMLRLTLPF